MLSPYAVEQSQKKIGEQIAYIKEKRPYIVNVMPIDNKENMKADYLCGVDAVGIGDNGRNYNLQFKVRSEGNNDFMLVCKKLTGKAVNENEIGFVFNDEKYTFEMLQADILIEYVNGKIYNISREELSALERNFKEDLKDKISLIRPKMISKDNGEKFFSGDYYCFIPTEDLQALRAKVFQNSL